MGRWRTNLALTAGTILLVLGLFEGFMRLTRSGQVSFFRADRELGFKQQAGFRGHHRFGERVEINALGLRDVERTYERPASIERRILVLGDSHAWGTGVDRHATIAAQLQARFENTEVINAAVPSYDTYQERVYLKRYGVRFRPDIVVLVFCDNDLDGVDSAEPLRALFNPSNVPPIPWLRDHSYAYGFVKRRIDILGAASDLADNHTTANWRVFETQFRSIQEIVTSIDAILIVAPIPDRRMLEGVRVSDVFSKLAALTATVGATYVDTVTPFEGAKRSGGSLFLDGDHHIDGAGHALIAEHIAAAL